MSGVQDPLEHELAFYDRHKSEWLPLHENHFVVVAGDTLLGFYELCERLGSRCAEVWAASEFPD